MPELHTPKGLDDFTCGYLEAAEWLLDEEADRSKVRGFTALSKRNAIADCLRFQRENAADLELFCEITGLLMDHAGHDFWLTRNGHGAGFWDRGAGEVGDRLTDAAEKYGEKYAEVYRGWISLI